MNKLLYLFFSEVQLFSNLSIFSPFYVIPFIAFIALGILFRLTATSKKSFYKVILAVLAAWLLGQVLYSFVFVTDALQLLFLAKPLFWNWWLSTFLVATYATHIVCLVARKNSME